MLTIIKTYTAVMLNKFDTTVDKSVKPYKVLKVKLKGSDKLMEGMLVGDEEVPDRFSSPRSFEFKIRLIDEVGQEVVVYFKDVDMLIFS